MATKTLKLSQIRLDGNTQPRVELDEGLIDEYKEAYQAEANMPPLDVMFDGASFWLWDGFHRRWGAERAGLEKVKCVVTKGTQKDAQWASLAANQAHGLRRSSADKAKAVKAALRHSRGVRMSDSRIAAHVGVDDKTVAKYRAELESRSEIPNVETRTDTKGRAQPAKKSGRCKQPDPQSVPASSFDWPDDEPAAPLAQAPPADALPTVEPTVEQVVVEPVDKPVVESVDEPVARRLSKNAINQLRRFDNALRDCYLKLERVNVPIRHPVKSALSVAWEAYRALHKAIETERNQ